MVLKELSFLNGKISWCILHWRLRQERSSNLLVLLLFLTVVLGEYETDAKNVSFVRVDRTRVFSFD